MNEMEKRRFFSDSLNHCYQKTVNGCLAFYTVSDYLVFFSLVCVAAKIYDIRIIKICIMPDHYHISCFCENSYALAAFNRYIESIYALEFNSVCGRSGRLFHKSFGSAPKKKLKAIRTNLIYVDNNPVERHLSTKAEEYRWNFLAFAISDHPFSEKINRRTASTHFKNAIQIVECFFKSGRFLRHATLARLFSKMNRQEKESLTDFIIATYSVIDYQYSAQLFGSYENNLIADHATTGSEYDIKESFTGKRDDVYAKMTNLLLNDGFVSDIHQIVSMNPDGKVRLMRYLIGKTEATPKQIACFLHI